MEASGTGDSGDQRGRDLCTCYPERGMQYGVEDRRNRLEGEREKAVRRATQGKKGDMARARMDWQRKTVSGWSEAKSGLSDNEVQAQSAGATGNCGNAPCHTSARLPQAKRRLSLLRAYSSAWPGHQRDWDPAVIGQCAPGSAGPAWLRFQRALGGSCGSCPNFSDSHPPLLRTAVQAVPGLSTFAQMGKNDLDLVGLFRYAGR